MSKVLSGHLQDEIYRIIEDSLFEGDNDPESITDKIAALFDGAAVGLCGNLSDGFEAQGIYADFDDAATCLDGEESWILTLELELIEKDIDG